MSFQGKQSVLFARDPQCSEAKPRETLRSEVNKTHCFMWDQSLSALLYLPTKKIGRYREEIVCLTPADSQHDLITT